MCCLLGLWNKNKRRDCDSKRVLGIGIDQNSEEWECWLNNQQSPQKYDEYNNLTDDVREQVDGWPK